MIAGAIANALLDESDAQGFSITPMQLQKLMYFLNGWHMEIHGGTPLISERFQAWQYGPVLPSLYKRFMHHGSSAIDGRSVNPLTAAPLVAELRADQKNLIDEIVRTYGPLTGPQMSNLTHGDSTPWTVTWRNGIGSRDDIAPDLVLREFMSLRNQIHAGD